jgi:signal peptidase I
MSQTSQGGIRKEKTARRRIWAAMLLSTVAPGLGQIYNGLPRRGLLALGLVLAGQAILIGLSIIPPNSIAAGIFHFSMIGLYGVLLFAVAFDAAFGALGAGEITLRRYHHPALYIAVALAWFSWDFLYDEIHRTATATVKTVIREASMEPTLLDRDRVLAHRGYYDANKPEAGDIVLYLKPGSDVTVIQRVVGLPGDSIQVTDGELLINGAPAPREGIDQASDTDAGLRTAFSYFRETLPNGASYIVSDQFGAGGVFDNTPVHDVPEGHVFIMGDNRDNSADSRIVGPVPIENLKARLTFIYWSGDRSRIGTMVQPEG